MAGPLFFNFKETAYENSFNNLCIISDGKLRLGSIQLAEHRISKHRLAQYGIA